MRISQYMACLVNGYGMPFSMVAEKFEDEPCLVVWADDETSDPWIKVRPMDRNSRISECTVHASQCSPLPKGFKI